MLNSLLDKLEEKKETFHTTKRDFDKAVKKRNKLLKMSINLEEVRVLFQTAAQVTQQQLSIQTSDIVSNALAVVFDDPYEFKVNFVKRRNVTECDLVFVKDGEEYDPLSSCGYGAADIASLALRVVYWKLDETNSRNCLILDEPLRNLSLDKQPLASRMIKNLCKIGDGLQFLIVTHNIALTEEADKVYKTNKTKHTITEE